jgi:hypothetical protein
VTEKGRLQTFARVEGVDGLDGPRMAARHGPGSFPVWAAVHLGPTVRLSQTPPRWARPSVPLGYNEPARPRSVTGGTHSPPSRLSGRFWLLGRPEAEEREFAAMLTKVATIRNPALGSIGCATSLEGYDERLVVAREPLGPDLLDFAVKRATTEYVDFERGHVPVVAGGTATEGVTNHNALQLFHSNGCLQADLGALVIVDNPARPKVDVAVEVAGSVSQVDYEIDVVIAAT